ncbi:MAG: NADH-quinone oxidoreductase subunit M [Phycisphaerales bacterium]|jgi:NADH-quinone oxidoreductase subunit M|nr:NADH-quinone oxidoreductase subunit M [Phycisphaerales bacterium]
MLLLLMLAPLAFAGLVLMRPASHARTVALWGTLVAIAIAIFAAVQFQWDWAIESDHSSGFQFEYVLEWFPALGLSVSVGADPVAMLLILLTALLGPICVLASWTAIEERQKTYFFWLLVLQAFVTGVFASRDLVMFYVCFEFTLLPLYVLISLFGSSNRKAAATKFFLYTFTGSILTLAGLVYVVWFTQQTTGVWTLDIGRLTASAATMSLSQQGWVLLALLAGFAVKVPLFPVHTWLPLAHTEAPTAGSVVLAGVLLKLGTYGIYRFALPMAPAALVEYAVPIAVLAIIGIIYAGLICWVQTDVKKLVAYSSVSHLGFCVLGLVALNMAGVSGSIMYMINHGLSTGALFLLIGMMYERYHTRSMKEVGGLAAKMPVWATFMVFFTMASVGLPGLNGFVSEFMCLLGTFQSGRDGAWRELASGGIVGATYGPLGPWFAAVAGTGMIVAAMYLLYMLGKVVFGPLREPDDHHAHPVLPTDLSAREIGILLPLAALCVGLGVYPTPVLKTLESPVRNTIAWVERHASPVAMPHEGLASEGGDEARGVVLSEGETSEHAKGARP